MSLVKSSDDYSTLIQCLQPVITMCNPLANEKNDLESIKNTILEILQKNVENLIRTMKEKYTEQGMAAD